MLVQILLILELLAATILFNALVTAWSARNKSFFVELVIWFAFLGVSVLPWIMTGFLIIYVFLQYRIYAFLMYLFCSGFTVNLLMFITLIFVGMKKTGTTPKTRRAASWNIVRLVVLWLAVYVAGVVTFLTADVIQKEISEQLKNDACEIAQKLAPESVPDDVNGAILCQKAKSILDERDRHNGVVKDRDKWSFKVAEWHRRLDKNTLPQDTAISDFLKKNFDVIELLHKAGRLKTSNWNIPYNPPELIFNLPEIGRIRAFAKILCLSAYNNAYKGDTKEAISDLNSALSLSNQVLLEPLIIPQLVSISSKSIVFECIKNLLSKHLLKGEDICDLKIDPNINCWNSFRKSALMESCFPLHAMGQGPAEHYSARNSTRLIDFSSIYRVLFFEEDYARYQKWFHQEYQPDKMTSYLAYLSVERKNEEENENRLGFYSSMVFSMGRCPELVARSEAEYRILLLLQSICSYKKKNGEFPDSPEKLLPDFIKAVPIDPFTEKPLKYIRARDGKVTLYSFGKDLIDDNGAEYDSSTQKGDITLTIGE